MEKINKNFKIFIFLFIFFLFPIYIKSKKTNSFVIVLYSTNTKTTKNIYFPNYDINTKLEYLLEIPDISLLIEYFYLIATQKFEKIHQQPNKEKQDQSSLLRKLDSRKRKALELFKDFEIITSKQIGALFGIRPRTSSQLCSKWVDEGFFIVVDPSRKGRKYKLAPQYEKLIEQKII